MKDLEIELDKSSKVKLYHQLYQIFADKIKNGQLTISSKLPSIRTLSEDYNISRNTVTKAYSELEKDGYIYSLSKSGYFVKDPNTVISIEKEKNTNTRKTAYKSEKLTEDDDIPTVKSLLENISQEKTEESPKELEILNTNLDADPEIHKTETIILRDSFSVNEITNTSSISVPVTNEGKAKETSLLMNSGDIVKSVTSDETILSPNEAFVDSCITALKEHHNRLAGDKKTDMQGEAPLRIAVAAFIYKFHHIDINPAQIFLGSSMSVLLYQFLQLNQFQHPSKYVHGLLHLAQNSISQDVIEPVAAFSPGIDSNIIAAFKAAGIKTVILKPLSTNDLIEKLEEIKATIFISSTRTISSRKVKLDDSKALFEWVGAKEYRYLFEYDNSTEATQFTNEYSEAMKSRCVYLNSFSNLISKSINTSFIAVSRELSESFREKFEDFGSPISMIDQVGLIDFLIKGKLYNYLTQMEQL